MKSKRVSNRLLLMLVLSLMLSFMFESCLSRDTDLIETVKSGNYKKTEDLLKKLNKDDVNQTGHGKTSSLIFAIRMDRTDLVKLLVRYGANVNIEEITSGGSPLMIAVLKQQVDIVQVLAENGADVNYRDLLENKTVMDVAYDVQKKHSTKKTKTIAEYLRTQNAKISAELPPVSDFETFFKWHYVYLKPLFPYLIAIILIAPLFFFFFPNNFVNKIMRKRIVLLKREVRRQYKEKKK